MSLLILVEPNKKQHNKQPKIWVRVVETHATRTWVAIILSVSGGLSLNILVSGAVWNTLANPEVTDLSSNYMTAIAGVMNVVFTGLVGYLGYQVGAESKTKQGEVLHDDDITLEVEEPDDEKRNSP